MSIGDWETHALSAAYPEHMMPRFFFDIHDGRWDRDQSGHEFTKLDDAIVQAKRFLPAMTLDQLPRNGNQHTVTVLVTDEERQPVYTATLTFSSMVLS